jgi:small subunit ribosomal protein S21
MIMGGQSGDSRALFTTATPCLHPDSLLAGRLLQPFLCGFGPVFVAFRMFPRIDGVLVRIREVCRFMQILVRDNNVDQALRALKKKLQREGVYREMKLRRHFEKPSEKRAREKAAAVRRARKLERKRVERDGGK